MHVRPRAGEHKRTADKKRRRRRRRAVVEEEVQLTDGFPGGVREVLGAYQPECVYYVYTYVCI